MQITQLKWRHFGERDPHKKVSHLVVHCFAFPIKKNLKLWDELGVGPHYMIDERGNVSQFVSESKVAWHAGKSFWRGKEGLNNTSIGIELYSPSFGQDLYSEAQMVAFIKLAKKIIKKYHIPPENVVGHSDIAPTRKVDPNVAFPWRDMALKGIGLWPTTKTTKQKSLKHNKTLLKEIGYDVTDEQAALYAFMRHFMPERIALEKQVIKAEDNLPRRILQMSLPDKAVRTQLLAVANTYSKKR